MASDVTRVTPEERTMEPPSGGMTREEAVATDRMWAGFARTEPGSVSGWHHHGDYESAIYVISGHLRMEFGAGGAETVEAGAGDFVHIGPRVIHRESNPGRDEAQFVVVRAGAGQLVFGADGPA